jgi:hypothetical protein
MSECEHRGASVDGRLRCERCGVQLCTDCGCRPVHEDSPSNSFCRRCAEKGGHRYAFSTEIDHDKLRSKVGRDLAREIITECVKDW